MSRNIKLLQVSENLWKHIDEVFEAGEQSALAGSKENPDSEAKEAEIRKFKAGIQIFGIVGQVLDIYLLEE